MRQKNRRFHQFLNFDYNSHAFAGLSFFILLFFSMPDFYKFGYRIFDIAAYIIIISYIFFSFRLKSIAIPKSSIFFFAIVGFYTVAGFFSTEAYKTIFAIFVNCCLFYFFLSKNLRPSQDQIKIVLIIHLLFFFFQFLYFYVAGNIANYHFFTDIDPRLESTIFRPAGLFYEPAIYCFVMFIMATMLDTKQSKYGLLEAVVMVSMIISVSLLGFVFAAFILIRLVSNRKLMMPLLCIISIVFIGDDLIEAVLNFIENRVVDLDSDGSANDRYGNVLNIFSFENLIYHLVGRGFGAGFEQFGSSGFSAAISAVGIVGVILFSVWVLLRSRELLVGFLSLVAIMLSAPIFTYGIFPYWIANMVLQKSHLNVQ